MRIVDAKSSTVPLGRRERRAATAVTSDHDMYPHWVLLCCGDSEWRVFLWFLHSATCPASCDHPSEPVNSDVWTLCVWCYSKKEAVFNLTNKTVKIWFFELVVGVGSKNMEFKCQLHCTKHFNLKQIKSYRSEKVIKRKVLTFNLNIEVYFLLFSKRTFLVQKNFYYKV